MRKIGVCVAVFLCVVIGIFVIGREKYAYPTKVEKLNFNVSKCGTLAQSKAKRGAKKVKINYEKILYFCFDVFIFFKFIYNKPKSFYSII